MLTFLVAESGLGKSIACFRLLNSYINNGGYGIHLPNSMMSDDCITFDLIIEKILKSFCPTLETGSAAKIKFMKKAKPFLIVIDDINKLSDTENGLKKLLSWFCTDQKSNDTTQVQRFSDIHVICPVWPNNLKKIDDILSKVTVNYVYGKMYEAEEAINAIRTASQNHNQILSQLEVNNIAKSLNYDPLLIGLWSDSLDQVSVTIINQSNQVISNYIERQIKKLTSIDTDSFEKEFLNSLDRFGESMLNFRVLDPSWDQVSDWFKEENNTIERLRKVIQQKTILSLDEHSERIIFRHDRIRDYILAHSFFSLMRDNKLNKAILEEPYYAELIGRAFVIGDLGSHWAESIKESNPLALFYALKIICNPSTDWQNEICSAINNWLENYSEKTCLPSLLNEIEIVLSETDSLLVNKICDKLNHQSWCISEARFRNGDISAGAYYCHRIEPTTISSRRDLLIEHVYTKYGDEVIEKLSELLKRADVAPDIKNGALNLSGYFVAPRLIPAIEQCWNTTPHNSNLLSSAIWAAAMCCHIKPENTLEPMFDYWNTLSDVKNEYHGSDVIDVAYYGLRFAFRHHPPQDKVVSYFVEKAKSEKLHWALSIVLEEIDNPDAIEYIVREAAALDEKGYGTSIWLLTLQQNWDCKMRFDTARTLCDASKQRLIDIWTNENESKYVRKWAMKIWSASTDTEHLKILREVPDSSPLYDLALQRRMILADPNIEDEVVKKLETAKDPGYWWQFCHYCWGAKLNKALDAYFRQYFDNKNKDGKGKYTSSYWAIYTLIMRIPISEAEAIIVNYWEKIQHIYGYFQAALYVGTEKCLKLVSKAVTNSSEPKILFEHIDSHFGFNTIGLRDLINQNHLEHLKPYLDFLSDMAIWDMWSWCNKHDFFEWRRKYLDKRLSVDFLKRECFTDEANYDKLDEYAKEFDKRYVYVDWWLERFRERNDDANRPMQLLSKWLSTRKTIEAFKVAARILSIGGRRSDLSILDISIPGTIPEGIKLIRDSTNYQVKRRSLK
jgi:hypothetical protein